MYSSVENTDKAIIKLWENYIEIIIDSADIPLDYLHVEIKNYVNNKNSLLHKPENNNANNNFEEDNRFNNNISKSDSWIDYINKAIAEYLAE